MSTETQHARPSRRRIGILAGVAGGLLLLGGTTFALWSDSAFQPGGTIETGNLDVEPAGATTYWDTSADRTDATATTPITALDAHAIPSLAAYSIVPGDTLEADYGFAVALEGDNLVAEVNLTLAGGAAPPTGVSFAAQVWYLDGATWTAVGTPAPVTPGVTTPIALGNFQAANQLDGTVDAGDIPIIALAEVPATGATPNLAVVVTATFDAATTGRTSTLTSTALGDVTVTVDQTREPGVGNFD